MSYQQIFAREAYDAADAIFHVLENAQRRALAAEINDLSLYLKNQMHNQHRKADPQTVRSRRLTFDAHRICCPACGHTWVVGQFDLTNVEEEGQP